MVAGQAPGSPERIRYDWIIKAGLQRFYPDFAVWLLGDRPLDVAAIDAALALDLLETDEHRGKSYASVVIYLDERTYHGDRGTFVLPGKLGFRLLLDYKVIKLWEEDPQTVLDREIPGLWPFAVLMSGNPEDLIVKSKSKIFGAPGAEVPLDAKGLLLAILGTLAVRRIPDRRTIEGLVSEFRKMGENLFLDILIEQCRTECIADGRAKNLAESRAESRAAAARTLQRILARKFGSLGEDIPLRLEAIEDLKEIERLNEEAAFAPTIEDFLAALDRGPVG